MQITHYETAASAILVEPVQHLTEAFGLFVAEDVCQTLISPTRTVDDALLACSAMPWRLMDKPGYIGYVLTNREDADNLAEIVRTVPPTEPRPAGQIYGTEQPAPIIMWN